MPKVQIPPIYTMLKNKYQYLCVYSLMPIPSLGQCGPMSGPKTKKSITSCIICTNSYCSCSVKFIVSVCEIFS